MAWIQLYDTLPDHDKVIMLSDLLNIDKDAVVGKLVRLWTWSINNREDGVFRLRDAETIAEVMRFRGKPKRLVDALVQANLLDFDGELYTIHGWDERVGMLLAKRETARAKTRERVQKHRKKEADVTQCNADVTRYVTADVTHCNAATVQYSSYDDDDDDEEDTLSRVREAARNAYEAHIGRVPTPSELDAIAEAAAVLEESELVGEAIKRAGINGARSVRAYVSEILKEWSGNGIRNVDDLAEYDFLRDCALGKNRALEPGDALIRLNNNRTERLRLAAD